MPLPREHLLDELATAYVQAVAAMGGAVIAVSRREYGVDGTVKHIATRGDDGYFETGFPVEFQLKGTTVAAVQGAGAIRYDLAARNYNLIVSRPKTATPYYLFLVCFDRDPASWATIDRDRLMLRASAFWWTESRAKTENTSSVRIEIPVANRLTFDAIVGMLNASEARFSR